VSMYPPCGLKLNYNCLVLKMSSSILFRLVYECSLIGYGAIQLPSLLFKRRSTLANRFAFRLPKIREGGFRVWIHAVSVGEVRAALPLVEKLYAHYSDMRLILSTGTATGLAEAERLFPQADARFILPFDLAMLIRPVVARYAPDLVLLVETDFWFNFLDAAKRGGARIALVNGKISERSAKRHSMLSRRLFDLIDCYCLQDSVYLERFDQLGIDDKRLFVTGNIKLDQQLEPMSSEELEQFREELKIPKGARVVVIGSSHDPEERKLLEQLLPLMKARPDLRLIVVPRHPERFDEADQLCQRTGLLVGRYSRKEKLTGEERIVLIDAMGKLLKCYQLAHLALVAGSWTQKVGGHNVLEPTHFCVPALFGPHMASQPTLERIALESGAGEKVAIDRVAERVSALLDDRESMVAAARELRDAMGGATEETFRLAINEAL